MKIGAQLFTIHDYAKDLDGFAESLKKVADIGYTSVQVSGTCAYEPEWLKEQLDKNGLTCDLTHTPFDRMVEMPETVVAEHKIFNCKYIGVGSMPRIFENPGDKSVWEDFSKKAVKVGEEFKKSGAYLMYHNHDREFFSYDGERCIDYLAREIAPDLMGFTLDTHWVKAGGYDPVETLKALKGRLPCVHFKDLTHVDGERRFAPIGAGELDFDAIIKTCEDLNVEFAFVEQDNCYGEDPFKCLKQSYDYLKSRGLK